MNANPFEFTGSERGLLAADRETRDRALGTLLDEVHAGQRTLPAVGRAMNLHCHSTFSYNAAGLTPAALAWRGRTLGLLAMGLVDFDVLDGVEEFLQAARRLNLRACASLETRVFVPDFAARVINSPGEPGIAYHMGAGFCGGPVANTPLLERLKTTAQHRNRGMVLRVNAFLAPLELDYDAEVLPRTPMGNATERHICAAYMDKAAQLFPDGATRAAFWSEKLEVPQEKAIALLDDPVALQNLMRARLMKSGGPGYVRPEGSEFPRLDEVCDFARANGAIPTFAWLDGGSDGEQALEELLDTMMRAGVAAANIIPDRNWNIADAARREICIRRMHDFAAAVRDRALPLLAGTEMNAPGQPFVDDFDAPPMQPLYDQFVQGAFVLAAHTALRRASGLGYCSDWAIEHFPDPHRRVAWYARVGAHEPHVLDSALREFNETHHPAQLLARLP